MKKLFLVALCVAMSASVWAQKAPEVDKSPLDISYYPSMAAFRNFEQMKGKDGVGEPVMRVIYSRPMKKDRAIFGELVKYGEVWRLGANENTELKVFKACEIGGKKVAPGTYSLHAIPSKDKWTIILSSDLDSWGSYAYDEANDVARVEASVSSLDEPVEAFSIYFTNGDDSKMVMAWDNVQAAVSVK